jgi:hypothetical protein
MKLHRLAVALVHHPVLDRRGDVVTSALTNLDVHDIARTARTYGVGRFYVVTPLAEQLQLLDRILGHWRDGHGAGYNPDRKEALSLVAGVPSLAAALDDWQRLCGAEPLPVLTAASRDGRLTFRDCARMLAQQPLLLVLGTGWGLAPELFQNGWPVLTPIRGAGSYNHLPVRAAAAIMLDRLGGQSG